MSSNSCPDKCAGTNIPEPVLYSDVILLGLCGSFVIAPLQPVWLQPTPGIGSGGLDSLLLTGSDVPSQGLSGFQFIPVQSTGSQVNFGDVVLIQLYGASFYLGFNNTSESGASNFQFIGKSLPPTGDSNFQFTIGSGGTTPAPPSTPVQYGDYIGLSFSVSKTEKNYFCDLGDVSNSICSTSVNPQNSRNVTFDPTYNPYNLTSQGITINGKQYPAATWQSSPWFAVFKGSPTQSNANLFNPIMNCIIAPCSKPNPCGSKTCPTGQNSQCTNSGDQAVCTCVSPCSSACPGAPNGPCTNGGCIYGSPSCTSTMGTSGQYVGNWTCPQPPTPPNTSSSTAKYLAIGAIILLGLLVAGIALWIWSRHKEKPTTSIGTLSTISH